MKFPSNPPVLLLLLLTIAACKEKKPLFTLLDASRTGIAFSNTITENDSINVLDFEYLFNGGGVGVGDVNNDGLSDLFFSGNQVPSRLYINRGNLSFEDVTATAGLRTKYWSTGVSMVDLNGDGLLDIYVCTISPRRGKSVPNELFINMGTDEKGRPHFREAAAEAGLDDRGYSTQAAFLDYDKDGDLDCYLLTNALESYNRNQPRGQARDGMGKSTDRLYRNNGTTGASSVPSFTDVSREAGIQIEGWGLGVAVSDINQDGWPDVYCANDFLSGDLLWINNRDGTFTNRAPDLLRHQSYNSMGVDIADLNNDGHPEIMTLDMLPDDNRRQKSMFANHNVDRYQYTIRQGYAPQFVRNMLQLNNGPRKVGGDPSFSEIGQLAGVSATDWSWSTLMADFDNDGYRDILISNGYPPRRHRPRFCRLPQPAGQLLFQE
jgi:hypothetical protein